MTDAMSLAPPIRTGGADGTYIELARQVRAAGLFDRAARSSVPRIAVIGLLWCLGWAALWIGGDSWYQLLTALYLAFVGTQIAFLGHDAGHRQLFRSRRLNELTGLTCANLCSGISFGYWVDKHDRHHSRPNEVGADPDIAPGVIAWTAEQASSKRGLARFVSRHQAALFFPMLLLEGLNLHIASVRALWTEVVKRTQAEIIMLVIFAVSYLGIVFWVLSPLRAIGFIVVQQGVFGLYLGCTFAPNHKGMAMTERGAHVEYLTRQVSTSRNVRGGRALALAMGGLNYQIEHHLFPTMPMAKLRNCQGLVRDYCSAHKIQHHEASLVESYRAVLDSLREVGAPGTRRAPTSAGVGATDR